MLQVDARQGAPKVGNTPFENFQVVSFATELSTSLSEGQ